MTPVAPDSSLSTYAAQLAHYSAVRRRIEVRSSVHASRLQREQNEREAAERAERLARKAAERRRIAAERYAQLAADASQWGEDIAKARAVIRMSAPSRAVMIMKEVAAGHGLTIDDIRGPVRTAPVVKARFEAIRKVYDMRKLSLPQIGRLFNRDHTSILNALRKTETARG